MYYFLKIAFFSFCIFAFSWFFVHSTLAGHTVQLADITYQCAEDTSKHWVCFETFETWYKLSDLRVAFHYDPQSHKVIEVILYD